MSRRFAYLPMFDTDRETRLRQRIDELRAERDRQADRARYHRREHDRLRAEFDERVEQRCAARCRELEHEVARWKGKAQALHGRLTFEHELRLRLTRPKRKETAA